MVVEKTKRKNFHHVSSFSVYLAKDQGFRLPYNVWGGVERGVWLEVGVWGGGRRDGSGKMFLFSVM